MNSLFRSLRPSLASRRPTSAILWDAVRSSIEPLERRALLSANITVSDINSAETSHSVSVAYNDPDGVDVSTIDASDLNVSGPKPVGVSLVSTSGSGTDVTAVYSLAGPDGSWDASDSGGYGITIPVDAVKDSLGNNLLSDPVVANFDVAFPPAAGYDGAGCLDQCPGRHEGGEHAGRHRRLHRPVGDQKQQHR